MKQNTPPKAYYKFKDQSNKVLEDMLQYSLNEASNVFKDALLTAEEVVSRHALFGTSAALIESRLMKVWSVYIDQQTEIIKRLSRAAFVLSKAAEAEALGRVLPGGARLQGNKDKIDKAVAKENVLGGDIRDRIRLMYERQAAKIAYAVRMGQILHNKPKEILDRVRKTYPALVRVKRPRKALVKVQESEPEGERTGLGKKDTAIQYDFMDQNDWDGTVELYKDTYLPTARFGDQGSKFEPGFDRYQYEYEQEATEDFVDKVRSGEVEAANDNGIDDFVWSAVIDDRTDECCRWRDTLLVSEIEKELEGEHADDDCDATVPPAHPNCRCRALPVSSEYVDKDQSNFQGIDEWLNAE